MAFPAEQCPRGQPRPPNQFGLIKRNTFMMRDSGKFVIHIVLEQNIEKLAHQIISKKYSMLSNIRRTLIEHY